MRTYIRVYDNGVIYECLFYKKLKNEEKIIAFNLKNKGNFYEVQIGNKKEILINRKFL
jgi:hypothetical protein